MSAPLSRILSTKITKRMVAMTLRTRLSSKPLCVFDCVCEREKERERERNEGSLSFFFSLLHSLIPLSSKPLCV